MNNLESLLLDYASPLPHVRPHTLHAPRHSRYAPRVVGLLLLMALLSGCEAFRSHAPPTACYYLNPDKSLCNLGRVAVVELDNNSSYPQVSEDVTKALFHALQKKQLFSLTIVGREDPKWRSLQLNSDSTYTLKQLSALRRTLNCNAVLIGTVTEYQPYPHMTLGLRLKLVDLQDGQLLWAFEQIWDSADKTTEQRIRSYFKSQMRSGFVPLREQLVALSPLRFIRFAAYEVAETLQPRNNLTATRPRCDRGAWPEKYQKFG